MIERRPRTLERDGEQLVVEDHGDGWAYLRRYNQAGMTSIGINAAEIIPVIRALATSEAGRSQVQAIIAELLHTEAAQELLVHNLQREYERALGIHHVQGGYIVHGN